jgi:hypothetical protein
MDPLTSRVRTSRPSVVADEPKGDTLVRTSLGRRPPRAGCTRPRTLEAGGKGLGQLDWRDTESSLDQPEERLHLVDVELGLLEGGEVAAPPGLVPVADIEEAFLFPPSGPGAGALVGRWSIRSERRRCR